MITDRLPTAAGRRRDYERSDALVAIALPPEQVVQPPTRNLVGAMGLGEQAPVAAAAGALLESLAGHYGVLTPSLRVLGIRPHRVAAGVCTYQLFGDYTPSTQRIRVWMRTAIRAKVSSPKAFVNVLIHEFCHHLDVAHLGCPETFHTRGFYSRIDQLYHHALATPPGERRPLRWIKRGGVWTVDWRALRPLAARTPRREASRAGADESGQGLPPPPWE